ncbi:hypothetical protein CKO25_10615 [Thiocapsa imhoffii]|uniref:Glycosyltransferase n=1 Tax=Thiocapsa imhoffii TaxID=382777 RepID=A0A9X1B9J8_9GAMM|nr:hypothetical protein [Thiocapsa imhoffii]MBK1645096.1 hypothetical protein [Thiocapsa imhoffii]
MTSALETITVIIRSVGERTESVCRQLILDQGIEENAIFVIREAPFSQAMRVGFQIGLAQGRPWTFCVDADLLLRPGSILRMVELAEEQPENVCEIQGYILDKFFGGPRIGGIHLYRTALLERVLAAIPAEGVDIRPEYHTLQAMKAAGFPWVLVPELVGLHDFEQSYRDIYRKCFVQAHKHAHFTDLFLSIWRASAAADDDYRVALAGFARGIEHHGAVRIDARSEPFRVSLDAFGIDEKAAIAPADWSLDQVERIIVSWSDPEMYRNKFPTRMGLVPPPPRPVAPVQPATRLARLRRRLGTQGLGRTVPYAFGWLLQRIGQRIQRIVAKP